MAFLVVLVYEQYVKQMLDFYFIVCVSVCVLCVIVCLWMSEDNLWMSVVIYHYSIPVIELRLTGLASSVYTG